MNRIEREKLTVSKMIALYCAAHHNSPNALCQNCMILQNYAFDRIKHCPFLPQKPVCSECKKHCYKSIMQDEIRLVMRYAGPRMLFRHPVLVVQHLIDKWRFKA